jgi:hypothetical protein
MVASGRSGSAFWRLGFLAARSAAGEQGDPSAWLHSLWRRLQPRNGRVAHTIATRDIHQRLARLAPCQCLLPLVRGRPNRTPRSFARLRPSPVRARINSRSNLLKPQASVQTGDNGASALAGPHHELAYQKRLAEGPRTPKGQVTTCSYNCHDYSEAIALRKEDWINGCRSGKQISRMLRNPH